MRNVSLFMSFLLCFAVLSIPSFAQTTFFPQYAEPGDTISFSMSNYIYHCGTLQYNRVSVETADVTLPATLGDWRWYIITDPPNPSRGRYVPYFFRADGTINIPSDASDGEYDIVISIYHNCNRKMRNIGIMTFTGSFEVVSPIDISLESATGYAGYQMPVDIALAAGSTRNIKVFLELYDESSLIDIAETDLIFSGQQTMTLVLDVPDDLEEGRYKLIATVSDNEKTGLIYEAGGNAEILAPIQAGAFSSPFRPAPGSAKSASLPSMPAAATAAFIPLSAIGAAGAGIYTLKKFKPNLKLASRLHLEAIRQTAVSYYKNFINRVERFKREKAIYDAHMQELYARERAAKAAKARKEYLVIRAINRRLSSMKSMKTNIERSVLVASLYKRYRKNMYLSSDTKKALAAVAFGLRKAAIQEQKSRRHSLDGGRIDYGRPKERNQKTLYFKEDDEGREKQMSEKNILNWLKDEVKNMIPLSSVFFPSEREENTEDLRTNHRLISKEYDTNNTLGSQFVSGREVLGNLIETTDDFDTIAATTESGTKALGFLGNLKNLLSRVGEFLYTIRLTAKIGMLGADIGQVAYGLSVEARREQKGQVFDRSKSVEMILRDLLDIGEMKVEATLLEVATKSIVFASRVSIPSPTILSVVPTVIDIPLVGKVKINTILKTNNNQYISL